MNRWTRRSLLFGGACVAVPTVGVIAGKLWCHSQALPTSKKPSLSMLTSLYPTSPEIRLLGQKYLDQTGSSVSASVRRVAQHDSIVRAATARCRTMASEALEQACRDDFRSGRMLSIDGWILAQTELDIAALSTIG